MSYAWPLVTPEAVAAAARGIRGEQNPHATAAFDPTEAGANFFFVINKICAAFFPIPEARINFVGEDTLESIWLYPRAAMNGSNNLRTPSSSSAPFMSLFEVSDSVSLHARPETIVHIVPYETPYAFAKWRLFWRLAIERML